MTITITLLVLAVIGLLVYALSNNSKVAEVGRICFFCALLAMCFEAMCFEVAPHAGGLKLR